MLRKIMPVANIGCGFFYTDDDGHQMMTFNIPHKLMFLFQKEGVRYYRLKIRNFPIKVPRGTKDGIDMGKRKCY